ncbi:MAG TPA: hypothetical protein VFK16_06585 [Gemmatimonadaceae bacterium]|jgi:hypothetical protein|nr:hypothetical protein [Gemmatimonadaceae bacterium]
MPSTGSAKHRPGFHVLVLSVGFVAGGLVSGIFRHVLPAGAARNLLVTGVTPAVGPLPIDLGLIKFSAGPVALDVTLLSLIGVFVAYLIARSLF